MINMLGPPSKAAEPLPVNVNALMPDIRMLPPTNHHVPCAPPRTKSLTLELNFEKPTPSTSMNTR